jgi:hypothetical protein
MGIVGPPFRRDGSRDGSAGWRLCGARRLKRPAKPALNRTLGIGYWAIFVVDFAPVHIKGCRMFKHRLPGHPKLKPPREEHYSACAEQRLAKLPLFDLNWYLSRNPDIANSGTNPYKHWLINGYEENRDLYDYKIAARAIGSVKIDNAKEQPRLEEVSANGLSIALACHTKNNEFINDICNDLSIGLRRIGANVSILSELDDPNQSFDKKIIIAPHGFFHRGFGTNRWHDSDVISSCFMLETEQAQTTWYRDAIPYLLMSKGVIDFFFQSMTLLQQSGIPAVHYVPDPEIGCVPGPPGYKDHPLFQALPEAVRGDHDVEAPIAGRPLDVCYFALETEHRDRTLARLAPVLSRFQNCIYQRRSNRGALSGSDARLVSVASHVASASKIMLNLHRDQFGAFEWHRIVRLGMCAGSVVVSETGLPTPGFISGKHYLEAGAQHLPELVEWILNTSDGKSKAEEVQKNALALLKKNHSRNDAAKRLVRFLLETV